MKRTLFTVGLGAAAMYYLDPELGEVRRSILRDKVSDLLGNAPKTKEAIKNKAHSVEEKAENLIHQADERAADVIESAGSNGGAPEQV